MPNETPKHSGDEMTPALRKALVECGAIIPTTPNEVELAEARLTRRPTPLEIAAAFGRLEAALDDDGPESPFMTLDDSIMTPADGGLAMAARNGEELDAETIAKIEQAVKRAMDEPSET